MKSWLVKKTPHLEFSFNIYDKVFFDPGFLYTKSVSLHDAI